MTDDPMRMTVHIASAGNEWLAELAVLSAVRHSSVPLDFVIGDSDGSQVDRLRRLERTVPVRVEVAPGRKHAEWIDHWIERSHSRFAFFLDSDVFIRRGCWVTPLLAELEGGAAIVSCEISEQEVIAEPVRGAIATMLRRPAPWVMAVDVEKVRATHTSFLFRNAYLADEILAWDVGGRVLEELVEAGEPVTALPDAYRRYYRHIGGMSWRGAPKARIEARRWAMLWEARARSIGERALARARPSR
jgi:hypothetical protein